MRLVFSALLALALLAPPVAPSAAGQSSVTPILTATATIDQIHVHVAERLDFTFRVITDHPTDPTALTVEVAVPRFVRAVSMAGCRTEPPGADPLAADYKIICFRTATPGSPAAVHLWLEAQPGVPIGPLTISAAATAQDDPSNVAQDSASVVILPSLLMPFALR